MIKIYFLKKININNFDFLRFVFALTIAISHFIELSAVDFFLPIKKFFNTRLAIDGFFIISGFLIAKSFEFSLTTKDYILRRIKRIFPAYLFVILISAFFLFFVSSKSAAEYFFNGQFWRYLLANLSFQNYFEPCLPGVFETHEICAINGALWTIKIEEAFYLSLPIFYWLFQKKYINFNMLIVITYVVSIVYFNYFIAQNNYRIAKQLPGAFSFFSVGILFYRNFDFLFKRKHLIIIPSLLLFILEQFVLEIQVFKPIAFGFMVFYLAYSFKFLNNFSRYGDFTYGIYIYHFPLIQVFIHFGLFDIYPPLFMFVFTIISVLILAILSWNYIELAFLPPSRKKRHQQMLN